MDNTQGTFTTSRFQEQVLDDIREYHCTGLPAPHRPGSLFWSILPYFIPEHYFFTYLTAIETFSQLYIGRTLYLHGFVCLPIPISVAVRQSIYEIFLANMPGALSRLGASIRFRFYFHHNPFEMSIRISQMNVLPYGATPYYESDFPHYL